MTSYAVGTRFYSLTGGTIPSFYDWYADLTCPEFLDYAQVGGFSAARNHWATLF